MPPLVGVDLLEDFPPKTQSNVSSWLTLDPVLLLCLPLLPLDTENDSPNSSSSVIPDKNI